MADIIFNGVVVDDIVNQLSAIEQNTTAKAIFNNDIANALSQSTGETVAVAMELNAVVNDILNEYETLLSATRVLISQINIDFAQTDNDIAETFRV